MMTAHINKIISSSNVDGPGNRLVIFFQGCEFNCLYCHNPETISICNSCGSCVSSCPSNALSMIDGNVLFNESVCINCDKCIHICPNSSSPKIKKMTLYDVMSVINRNINFIRGITISGGECMIQNKFLLSLFKKIKELYPKLSILLDSNGMHNFEDYEELLSYTDGVMLDVKSFDNIFHEFLTESRNDIVLKNLKYLLSINKLYEVRTVILPNFLSQNKYTLENVFNIINKDTRYKLIKYRPYGVKKENLSIFTNTKSLDEEISNYKLVYAKKGFVNINII